MLRVLPSFSIKHTDPQATSVVGAPSQSHRIERGSPRRLFGMPPIWKDAPAARTSPTTVALMWRDGLSSKLNSAIDGERPGAALEVITEIVKRSELSALDPWKGRPWNEGRLPVLRMAQ